MLTEAEKSVDCFIETERFRQSLPHSVRIGDSNLLHTYVYELIISSLKVY
jgi:hypothetical protein